MSYHFPYFEDRPHVPITVIGPERRVRYIPLLDSGADYTTLSKKEAILLGLDWNQGEVISLANADGTGFDAKIFRLLLEIEGVTLFVRICFVDSNHCPMPLLGRFDVFRYFKIIIDESAHMVELRSYSI